MATIWDVLRRYVKDESIDLVYLDPPFKSNQELTTFVCGEGRDGGRFTVQGFRGHMGVESGFSGHARTAYRIWR